MSGKGLEVYMLVWGCVSVHLCAFFVNRLLFVSVFNQQVFVTTLLKCGIGEILCGTDLVFPVAKKLMTSTI